jgi:hypothetical protein
LCRNGVGEETRVGYGRLEWTRRCGRLEWRVECGCGVGQEWSRELESCVMGPKWNRGLERDGQARVERRTGEGTVGL